MNSRIHLQQAAPNNQAADRYRNRFQRYSKLDKHDKGGLKQLKRELKQNNLLNLPGFPAASMKLSGRQRASLMSFNCSVLLLLYKNTLQPQEEQFIRNEQRLLHNLAQKLAQHGEPTTTESAFLVALTNEPTAGPGHLGWLQQVLAYLEEVRFYTLAAFTLGGSTEKTPTTWWPQMMRAEATKCHERRPLETEPCIGVEADQ